MDLELPDLNLGVAPVPEDDDAAVVAAEPAADYIARHAEGAPRDSVALNLAQERAKGLPAPDEAVKVREEARRSGTSFSAALTAPATSRPVPRLWSEYGENKALSAILLDPTKSVFTSEEDLEKFVLATDALNDPFPTTKLGLNLESGVLQQRRARLYFAKMVNGGVSSPADAAELTTLENRRMVLPAARGFGGQVLEGAVQQIPRFGRMAVVAGVGALAGAPFGVAPLTAGAAVTADNVLEAVGDTYAEFTTEWGMEHALAAPLSVLGGVVEGGLDTLSAGVLSKFPMFSVLSKLPLLDKAKFKPALAAALKDSRFVQLMTEAGKDVATEGGTEGFQEAFRILLGYAGAASGSGDYRTPTVEEAAARTIVAATTGAVVGGTVGGAATVAREVMTHANVAEGTKAAIDKLYAATDNLPVADRAPEVVKEFGDRLSQQGAPKNVTVLLQSVEPLFEENKDSAAVQAFLSRPDVARKMEAARTTGARLTLSLGDFLAYVRPLDKAGKLKVEVGLNDGMSVREAQELSPAIKKAKQEMQDIAKRREAVENSPTSMIVQDLVTKLQRVQKGVTAEGARMQAETVASGISALAKRVGKDPWEVYRSSPLSVSSITHEQWFTKTLEQADPNEVVRAPDSQGDMAYQHPESPLRLWTGDNSFRLAPDSIPSDTVVIGILGFDPSVPETKENIAKYGGQGYSTALYLHALADAKARGVGLASDTTRTPATKRMYNRLRRLGIPFAVEGDTDFNVEYLPADVLATIDLDAAWEKLLAEVASGRDETSGQFGNVSQAEIDSVLAGLVELRQDQNKVVRGRITFDPVKRDWFNITLTGKANLSTFLHEASHYLLEVMRKLAAESPGTGLDADLRALEEWAGVKPGEEWSVDALEKFARGMETYFGEGKAPSAKLAEAFATFKAWILHVYKMLTNIGTPLTDEVRGVMDRMLATQEEIDARRTELGYFPSKLAEGEMDPEMQLRYREMYERGAAQAQVRLDRAAIAALKKEKTAEHARIGEEVDKELDLHPAIALRAWFGTGDRIDGGLVIPELAGRKLDKTAVVEMKLGPGVLPRVGEYATDAKGVDPEELAPYFGYANGPEMVLALANTPPRAKLRTQMVKERMTALYPAYGDPAWVEKTALERLHDEDAIANAIELELAVIHKKLAQTPPKGLAAVAKMAAEQTVREMTREEQNVAQWRDAERRALKAQMEAWAAKKFEEAAEAGRQRLYARAMWAASNTAAKKMDAAKRYVQRFANPEVQGKLGRSSSQEVNGESVGGIFRDAAKAVVEAVGFSPVSSASAATLDTHLAKLEAMGLPVSVDPALRLEPIPTWEELSYAQTMAVRSALENIAHLAKETNTLRLEDERLTLDAVADEIEKNLDGVKAKDRLGQKGEKENRFRAWRAQIAKPETIALDIDGGKPGIFHRIWFGSAEKGQFERDRRFRAHRAGLHEIAKTYRPKDWTKQVRAKHKFVDGLTYTGEEVFAMLLNLGSESNRDKLIRGMVRAGRTGWTLDNVTAFIHKVFPDRNVYDYAQAVLSYISQASLWDDSARVLEMLSGTKPEKVTASAIPTPDGGQIEGGYYPVVYDRKVPLTDLDVSRRDGLDAMDDANLSNLYASHGFTEARTGYVAPILLNPRALAAHIYQVDHYIANAPGIVARHKLLTHPRVKASIVHAFGYDYWDQLRGSNNYIAADGRMLTRELLQASKMADKLIYHNALLVMGGNVLSGINQVVNGVPATLAYLGPRGVPAFAKALLGFAKSPFKTWQEVSDLSGEIEGMEFHYDRDLRLIVSRELGGDTWETLQSRIAATTMTPVVFGQKLVNVITWKAAFDLAVKDGKVGEEAVRYANSAVRQSQSTSGPKDMTAVQRSKDGLMRVLTSLASYTFTLNDMVMPRNLSRAQLAGATSRLVMLLLTTMVTKALFDAIFPKLEEKESERRKGLEKTAEESEVFGALYATEAMMDVLYNVPIVGRMGQAVVSGREARFASWVDTGIRALQVAPNAFSDKGLTESDLRAVVESIGLATGTPTRHLLFAPGEFMYEYLDSNVDETPWAFFQELALARPGQKGN
jgi:hypothetical protein